MIGWARIGYGVLLLALPDHVLRLVSPRVSARERIATRILGGRLLAQAAATDIRPTAVTVALGAEVDLVHAISMLVWAVVDRESRRLTLLSATLAALFAAVGAAQARRTPPPSHARRADALETLVRLRHRVAAAVVRRTMPSPVRARLNLQELR
ncbi:hypothetical protein [Mycobacterium sherrisii]|uniref:Uncharacterized protein n=1 Tax=Mycobacterium sherrisii TaxID=243061 RepID=A0A1E3SWW6_9MYCO|nr:hypothetical protein [Mycobacterium sherrisii]MCV7031892.1 hypothetical protein [Mycobacterium sherrisii]ODR06620.1 hypothetical protein BHQ21_11110 [Mycobacterium sherrisii]ORW85796.1 hypothetical protein AWC25_23030 [Mycobacterium sherrisii]